MIELVIRHDAKLETCPFRGPFFIKKRAAIEEILQNNDKYGSIPKYFNKNIDTKISYPKNFTIACHILKVKSVCFEYPYNHINTMDNKNHETCLDDAH